MGKFGRDFAREYGLAGYVDTSAKTGAGIVPALEKLLEEIFKRRKLQVGPGGITGLPELPLPRFQMPPPPSSQELLARFEKVIERDITLKAEVSKAHAWAATISDTTDPWDDIPSADRNLLEKDASKLDQLVAEIKQIQPMIKLAFDGKQYPRAEVILVAASRKLRAAISRFQELGIVKKYVEYCKVYDDVDGLLKNVKHKIVQQDYEAFSKALDGLLKEAAPDYIRVYAVLDHMRHTVEAFAIAAGRGSDAERLESLRDDVLKHLVITHLSKAYKVAESTYNKLVAKARGSDLESTIVDLRDLIRSIGKLEDNAVDLDDIDFLPTLRENIQRLLEAALSLQSSVKDRFIKQIEGEPLPLVIPEMSELNATIVMPRLGATGDFDIATIIAQIDAIFAGWTDKEKAKDGKVE